MKIPKLHLHIQGWKNPPIRSPWWVPHSEGQVGNLKAANAHYYIYFTFWNVGWVTLWEFSRPDIPLVGCLGNNIVPMSDLKLEYRQTISFCPNFNLPFAVKFFTDTCNVLCWQMWKSACHTFGPIIVKLKPIWNWQNSTLSWQTFSHEKSIKKEIQVTWLFMNKVINIYFGIHTNKRTWFLIFAITKQLPILYFQVIITDKKFSIFPSFQKSLSTTIIWCTSWC